MKKKQKAAIRLLIFVLICLTLLITSAVLVIKANMQRKNTEIAYKNTVDNLNYSISSYITKSNFEDDAFLKRKTGLQSMDNFLTEYKNWKEFFEANLINYKEKKN